MLCYATAPTTLAQKQKPNSWGEFTKEDLTNTVCVFYPSASAWYLSYSRTVSNFMGELNTWTHTDHKTHSQIKIVDNAGLADATTLEFSLYTEDNYEQLLLFRAAHYTIADARVKKEKEVGYNDLVITQEGPSRNYKYVFEKAQPGDIIEFQFEFRRRGAREIDPFYFQKHIPVEVASFRSRLPVWSYNKVILNGKRLLSKYDGVVPADVALTNLPPVVLEPYVARTADCAESITIYAATSDVYHVDQTKMFDEDKQKATREFAREIIRAYFYEEYLTGKAEVFKKLSEQISVTETASLENVRSVYQFVKSHFKHDSTYDFKPSYFDGLRQVVNKSKGTPAEINLILMRLLREKGLKADPVLISTRFNRKVIKDLYTEWQFNSLIVQVEVNGRNYFLDVRSEDGSVFSLPEEDLNGFGLVLNEERADWVITYPTEPSRRIVRAEVTDENGLRKWRYRIRFTGREALAEREAYADAQKIPDYYFSTRAGKLSDGILDSLQLIGFDKSDSKEMPVEIRFVINEPCTTDACKRMLSPFEFDVVGPNPFTAQERVAPIDFAYPRSYTYVVTHTQRGAYIQEISSPVVGALNGKNVLKVSQQKLSENAGMYVTRYTYDFELPPLVPVAGYGELKSVYEKATEAIKHGYIIVPLK